MNLHMCGAIVAAGLLGTVCYALWGLWGLAFAGYAVSLVIYYVEEGR